LRKRYLRHPLFVKSQQVHFWGAFRLFAWAGLLVLLAIYAYLAFRPDSSFFTVPWMPREAARRILSVTNYRNFWGFSLLGFYCAFFLGSSWWIFRSDRWQWATIAVWLVPVLKELMQSPIQGRHGTVAGSLYGMVGAMLGLALGSGCRTATKFVVRRFRKSATSQALIPPDCERDAGKYRL